MKASLLKYLLLIYFTLLVGCQKDNKTASDLIIGKWDWIKSVSPWTGQVSNPQTVMFSITLEFTGDGIMNEYKNDTLSNTTNYSIESNPTKSTSNILIQNSDIHSYFDIVNDSLIINTAYVDGPVSYYIRIK
jgi:hypothetical protein